MAEHSATLFTSTALRAITKQSNSLPTSLPPPLPRLAFPTFPFQKRLLLALQLLVPFPPPTHNVPPPTGPAVASMTSDEETRTPWGGSREALVSIRMFTRFRLRIRFPLPFQGESPVRQQRGGRARDSNSPALALLPPPRPAPPRPAPSPQCQKEEQGGHRAEQTCKAERPLHVPVTL